MNYLNTFRIPYIGLKLGQHIFEFEINKLFFNEYEFSIVKDGDLKATVTIEKQETLMLVDFDIEGFVKLSCDLCLNSFPSKCHIEEKLIVKFSDNDEVNEQSEEILVLTKKDYEFDVASLIYEYINLAVPFNNRCEDPGNTAACDREMIKKLETLSSDQNNDEKSRTDPRWEALNKIKKQ